MSYIINNNELISETENYLKSGTHVNYAYQSVESIFTNFSRVLVNAKSAKISNAKKWEKEAERSHYYSRVVNDFLQDFLIVKE